MPIRLPVGLRRPGEHEFAQVAYEVMDVVFAVHNEMGGLFDELIYKRAIAARIPGARLEVPLEVSFDTFSKVYSLDLLVADCAPFELKTVAQIVEHHRSQMLNYLLVTELPHGKLVNLRGEAVTQEFVNTPLLRKDRISFEVQLMEYDEIESHGFRLKALLVDMLRDWGTCLDIELYRDALLYFLGGKQNSFRLVQIADNGRALGDQKFHVIGLDTGLSITTLNHGTAGYEAQLRRFLNHTALSSIQWVNVSRKLVTFKTLKPSK